MHTGYRTSLAALFVCTILALASFAVFGASHERSWKDASEYDSYATNLVKQGLYSANGTDFDIVREPGYPVFLASVYALVGTNNVLAVTIVQALLLGLLGWCVYRVFVLYDMPTVGMFVALAISSLPFYGYYANEILTEPLFTVLLGILFAISAYILHERGLVSWGWFLALGTIGGYESLVRLQFLFFVPIACLFLLYLLRPLTKQIVLKIGIVLLSFLLIVGTWATIVYSNLGVFSLSAGRQEIVLNVRAVRAQLSYSELTRYGIAWVWRSISGGASDPLLDTYEWKPINRAYFERATTSEAVAQIKRDDINTILSRPGHYLYGNVIELMKLMYLEHDFTDSMNRYLRASIYVLMYLLFAFGLIQLVFYRGDSQLRALGALAMLFPVYNWVVVSMFDAIPRYNTPYLMFYIIIGFIGLALYLRRRRSASRSGGH